MSNKSRPNGATELYTEFLHQSTPRGLRTRYDQEHYRQSAMETIYYRKLADLRMSQFNWLNFPPEIDRRFVELTLMRNGLCVFFKDPTELQKWAGKFFALRGTPASVLDWQDNPLQYRVYGNSFLNMTLSRADCVPIWNNATRSPETDVIYMYAKRLAKIDRTLEINTDNARQTRVIAADENQRLTMQNLDRQIAEGTQTLKLTKGMAADLAQLVTVLNLDIDVNIFDKLAVYRGKVLNDCMSLLGVNNANQDKKERMVQGEVDSNNDQVIQFRNTALAERQKACEKINRMWGLNVSVEYNTEKPDLGILLGEGAKEDI